MNTHTNQTQIHVDSMAPLVGITREFDAPVAKVFPARTDVELFAQWNVQTFTFEDLGNGRTRLVATGMEDGVIQGYDRLAR